MALGGHLMGILGLHVLQITRLGARPGRLCAFDDWRFSLTFLHGVLDSSLQQVRTFIVSSRHDTYIS